MLLERPRRAVTGPLDRVLVPAAAWSLASTGLGLAWLLGAPGNPADPAVDDAVDLSALGMLGPQGGAALLTGLGVLGALLALGFTVLTPGGHLHRAATAGAGVLAGVLAVGLPDYRLLAAVGYTPVLAVLRLAGRDPGVQVWTWPVVHMALLTLAGLAWVAVAVVAARRDAYACAACGRAPGQPSWRSARAAARWGRWAVAVAVVVPVGYAVTRIAWALGFPLGVSRDLLDLLGEAVWFGAGLGVLALGGAVLTVGLVRPWGEVFPRWVPGLRGRRVPVAAAVVPAAVVALLVTSAGVMLTRMVLTGRFGEELPGADADVMAWLPELFWPLWGLALAAAAYAYWLRRRGTCARCGGAS
ncbi:hypothetical protein NUM3379_27200 [Kineococcus sp. NUM-3379]